MNKKEWKIYWGQHLFKGSVKSGKQRPLDLRTTTSTRFDLTLFSPIFKILTSGKASFYSISLEKLALISFSGGGYALSLSQNDKTSNIWPYNQSIIPSTDVIQLTLTLKMTTAQVVETSVTVKTTVLFRTTFTRMIKLNLHLITCFPQHNICAKTRHRLTTATTFSGQNDAASHASTM